MTGRPSKKRENKGAARKTTIVATAVRLFHERGFHNVSMDDIGAELKITGPALYQYFKGKHEVLGHAVMMLYDTMLEEETKVLPQLEPREQVSHLLNHALQIALEHRELAAVYTREEPSVHPRYRARIHERQEEIRKKWITAIRPICPGKRTDELRVIVEAILWMCRSAVFYEPRVKRERFVAIVREMAFRSLGLAPLAAADHRLEASNRVTAERGRGR